jgi:hypothetical protein
MGGEDDEHRGDCHGYEQVQSEDCCNDLSSPVLVHPASPPVLMGEAA